MSPTRLLFTAVGLVVLASAVEARVVTQKPEIRPAIYRNALPARNTHRWPSDYGVAGGRCNAQLVGALVGGPWAAAGRRGTGGSVAMLRGSVPGYAYGARFGPGMDAVDRSCIGHALEIAPAFSTVRWVNPYSQAHYSLTPQRQLKLRGNQCRAFSGRVILAGTHQLVQGTACRHGRGGWFMV